VAKLRGARERQGAVAGKCEGRKGRAEIIHGEAAKPTEAERWTHAAARDLGRAGRA
jgi:hypothetical protein